MPSLNLQDSPHCPRPLLKAIEEAPLPELGAGTADVALSGWIEENDQLGFSVAPADRPMAAACRSGLWLLAGDLDRSHTISQDIVAPEGSFWHGIMHRREGDFGNAKYWFSKTGPHPVLSTIGKEANRQNLDSDVACFPQQSLDPLTFVDVCQQAVRQQDDQTERCRLIQWLEWQALFFHCAAKAWPA